MTPMVTMVTTGRAPCGGVAGPVGTLVQPLILVELAAPAVAVMVVKLVVKMAEQVDR
jgi:hypothetical protein